jgi:amino acid adenylation domain-containing protein
MTTVELLSNLRSLNVKLWVVGERLRYSAPPGKLSPELLKQLAGHKAAIINFLRDASDASAPPPIEPVSRAQPLPLSYAQMRLWILNRLSTDNSAYHLPVALHLEGALDVAALRRSINEIAMRHEALRTVFTETDGRPLQTILPSIEVSLPVIDLCSLTSAEKEAELQKLASENALRPFDLSLGPLLRAVVLMLGEQEHVLCVTLHHIVSDGWSSGVLVREFAALYEIFSSGRAPSLPPLKVQYADFAVWQRQYLQGRVLERQLDYWKSRLGDHSPVLELPTDKPRPAAQTFRGATEVLRLARPLVEALNDLSRRQEVTLFMLLLAAFQSQLCRYTGQEDITVGSPIANRNRAETEPLIGFFVNTLVLRTDLSGDPSFSDLLQRVRETALEAYAHQDLPFELLVEELQPSREANRSPLFQIAFVLQNAPMPPLHLLGLTITLLPLENGTAKFDLTLTLRESENGELTAGLEYNTDIFKRATARRMLAHYEVLLKGVVENPDLRLSSLPLITEQERRQLLHEGEAAAPEFPDGEPLHWLFEARAAAAPDSTALIFGEERLSYRQLNARANQLAHRLRRLGIGPDSLVSICLERSVEMVVAVLGVLKAGGAYVPLDPASPAERLAWLLEDSRSPVLITSRTLLERLPSHAAKLLVLDDEREALARESDANPYITATTHHLAYVIYTSGSTGRPKGTLVSHYNVTRLFAATQPWFEFTDRDVWTLFHSYAFDFSVWELWGALLYGGKLVVVPYAVSRSPAAFYEMLAKERVTVLNQTPSAFRQLMQAEGEAGVSPDLSLRLVIFGGEALELQSLRPWFDRHGSTSPQLVNMYGITETTVHVTYRALTADDLTATPGSVIGGPIPDLQVYILDRHMQPVPTGVPGEMYIGGAGLARGYLNRPDLTAERYVPHPFDRRPGQRLYRSGDLARYLEGGDIEYFGRADNQVKIRGHRIELGEIEATLNQHPAVRESIAVAKDDSATGLSRLIAYVVLRHTLSIDELRGWLKRTLPDYMVPQLFVTLDSLPLTANGKVDYRALPEADMARPELGQGYVAPRTYAERELAEVWSEVLGFERVGVYDNFFDLGGDSIRAIQVHSKAQQRGVAFSPQAVFLSQTIAELAASSATGESPVAERSSEAFSLVTEEDRAKLPADIEDAYPLAMLQTGMIFHKEYSTASTAYLNVSSVHLRAPFDRAALEASLRQLAQRHPILRTSFDLTSFSEPLQLVHRYAEIPLKIQDLRALNSSEQEEVIEAWVRDEQGLDFDLTRAPLLRFTVHLRGENTFQLSWTEHHAILDGWSMATMMTELFRLYFSFAGEEVAPVLPPPRSTYRDFIARECATLASEECRQFWEDKLSGHSVLTLPRRVNPEQEAPARQIRRSFTISPELSASLKRLARRAGIPIKSVLLAAHLKVLSVLGNQSDVVTGLVSNGRLEEVDGERVLGLFLNTVPLRPSLRGGSWLELIRETFKAEQELLPFRRYPLAELQRKYSGGVPLFETMFNFTHFHVYEGLREIPRLEVLDAQSIAQTNYALAADFSLDLLTADIQMRLEYNAAKLGDDDVEAIGGYYLRAFEAMAGEPSGDYLSHSLLSAGERHRLLSAWNDTRRDYPEGATLHDLFEEQAARTPVAEALCCGAERVSYGELKARADRLARRLRRLGVGPESRVGVLMNRSAELVVALLGVLKAGGAYVPLDPAYPPERLRYMSEDAEMSVLLTQSPLADRLDAPAARVLCLDRLSVAFEADDEEAVDPPPPVSANNLAYVIYTSGSTGMPKGVAIEHRSAVVLVRWAREVFGEELLRGVLASTSVCFDLSVFELFVPLSWGGRVIMAENALHLPGLPQAGEVALVNTVPSAMAELLRTGGLPESVTTVNLAGEALKPELVEEVYGLGRVRAVYNLYGPSEDTTYSTYAPVGCGRRVTIGRPVANTQVYILNESLEPVPPGVTGELYIGGAGLARGYLNRPALTADKFIPDPFGVRPGARLYRTGDLGYYSPEGEIEFLGRVDQQVKIRGFRIETGEIESVLRRHPQVRESVVLAREDVPGDKRLVAYVVPSGAESPPDGTLREHLKTTLPDYMMPSAFVTLDSLPLMPNGKVDRKALPAPHASRQERADSYVGPRDTFELRLCRIWEDVLGVRTVGARDNFFDLGGNSLLAVRLMAQARKEFDRDIPINVLFQGATVEHLAGVLRGEAGGQSFSSLVGIQTSGSRPPLFFVHPVGGTVFCYLELSKYLGKDQPLYGLQAPGIYGEQEPLSRVEDLATHYLNAVRSVQPRGPYHLGGWSMGGVVAFEMARQLRKQGEEVAVLVMIDSALPQYVARLGDSVEEEKLLSAFLYDLGAQSGKDLPDLSGQLQELSAEEQLAYLLKQAESNDILPPQAQLESLLNVFKSNLRALTSYAPERYDGRLQLFRAAEGGADSDAAMAWDSFAEEVVTYSVPGNHYTLMTNTNVRALAALIKTHLDQGVGESRVS